MIFAWKMNGPEWKWASLYSKFHFRNESKAGIQMDINSMHSINQAWINCFWMFQSGPPFSFLPIRHNGWRGRESAAFVSHKHCANLILTFSGLGAEESTGRTLDTNGNALVTTAYSIRNDYFNRTFYYTLHHNLACLSTTNNPFS